MGVKFNKTDDLGKMFEEFAFDPFGDELAKRDEANQAEADKFLEKEQAQLAKNKAEEK